MKYEEFQSALKTLKLSDRASLDEIKARHRALVKQHHPDRSEGNPEKIREINAAYAIVTAYCRNYRFSFSQKEFYEQDLQERLRIQFGQEPF